MKTKFNLSKYKAPKIKIEVPQNWSLKVDDYHEFGIMEEYLKELGVKVQYEECGCDGFYEAVFWIGKKPVELIKATKETYND